MENRHSPTSPELVEAVLHLRACILRAGTAQLPAQSLALWIAATTLGELIGGAGAAEAAAMSAAVNRRLAEMGVAWKVTRVGSH
jgi:hypothetical protein